MVMQPRSYKIIIGMAEGRRGGGGGDLNVF